MWFVLRGFFFRSFVNKLNYIICSRVFKKKKSDKILSTLAPNTHIQKSIRNIVPSLRVNNYKKKNNFFKKSASESVTCKTTFKLFLKVSVSLCQRNRTIKIA